jgi:hypothetical protein
MNDEEDEEIEDEINVTMSLVNKQNIKSINNKNENKIENNISFNEEEIEEEDEEKKEDKFEIIKPLAKGGFGEVYLGNL